MLHHKSHGRMPAAAIVFLVARLAFCVAQSPTVQVLVKDAASSASTSYSSASYLVANGTTVQLTCNVSTAGGTYAWTHSIGDTSCSQTSATSNTLSHAVSSSNIAVICYKCTYTASDSSTASSQVILYPYTPPTQVASGTYDFSVVSEANATCSFSGQVASANATIVWTRASAGTAPLQTVSVTASPSWFSIVNSTSVGDVYYCHLVVPGANILSSKTNGVAGILLGSYTIATPPYAEMYSFDKKQYIEGDTVTASCKIFGYPITNYTWLRERKYPNVNTTKVVQIVGGQNISFTMTSLDHVSERGDYQCVAAGLKNGSAVVYVSAVKTLHARSKLAPLWPAIGIIAEFALVAIVIGISESVRSKKELAADGKAGGAHNDKNKKG